MSEKYVSHVKWMKRAIFLASLGKGKTSPNPLVGAVIISIFGGLTLYFDNPIFGNLDKPILVQPFSSIF